MKNRLQEFRRNAGLTQFELAIKAGLHPSAIAKFEQGTQSPRLGTAQAIARALGVSTDDVWPTETLDESAPAEVR